MDSLLHDIRYALRALRKNPGFASMAVVALALGIGANTAIFTVVDSILLRPLPYAAPQRLVVALHDGKSPLSPADFLDYRRGVTAFDQLAAAQAWGGNLTGKDKPEAVPGLQVTSNLLSMLGVQPIFGRTLQPEDEKPGGQRVLVVGHALWQRRFGSDPAIIGQAVTLDGKAYTVVGIMPPGFRFAPFWATQSEMWTPLILGDRSNDRDGRSLRAFGRLRTGVPLQQAQSQMDAIARRLADQYPKTNAKLGIRVLPLQEKVVGPIRPTLLVLLGTVAFVLLIACANVANLMLTRAIARRKEIALRLAIGASRVRLVRQLLTESLTIALLGGVAGLVLASAGVRFLVSILPPGSMPRQNEIGFDWATFLFALLATLLTGIVSGLAPAFNLSRSDLNENLKYGGRSGSQGARHRNAHALLVGGEVALALVLLVGAGLMIRTSLKLQSIDPGFQPRHLLTLTVSTAGTVHDQPERRPVLFKQLNDALANLPGVQSVSAINHLPIGGDVWHLGYKMPGRPEAAAGDGLSAVYRVVRTDYFRAMALPLTRGRDFNDRDSERAPAVAIVNQSMARRQWPGADPIGQQVVYAGGQTRTIVGVAQDARQSDWTSPIDDEIYLPYLQQTESFGLKELTFVIRTATDPERLANAARQRIWSVDRDLPVSRVLPMEQVIADHLWRTRLSVLLLSMFAGIALLLAAVGIYGVISYSVRRRTQEIGIRMALGAQRGDVLRSTIQEGMRPVLAGAGAGVLLAMGASRSMSSLLYGVKTTDPMTFAAVTALLLVVAALANFVPASRAARVDPLIALRHE